MNKNLINDIRTQAQFRGITFSRHKKSDVKNALLDNLLKGKIEHACHWAAEYICAGHYLDLWENILYFCAKYIHVGNPKLICYLEKRFLTFRGIITSGNFITPLELRNNPTIRNLFAEVVSVLCLSNKKHSVEVIKINKSEEFDIALMAERLKAPNINYATPIFLDEDPKEIFIPLNEFAYNVSVERRNTVFACYWIEWILEFETHCKKRKEKCKCIRRPFVQVDAKSAHDLVWLIWDVLFHCIKDRASPFLEKVMNSLFTLFCLHYTNACCKKRRYMLYFAVSLITENVDPAIEIVGDTHKVEIAVDNINDIYAQIKPNEESPQTDYLFSGLEKQNALARSMERLNMVNSLSVNMFSDGGDDEL
jgi:hypothetical protein